ncbi:hypothetical protein [Candidatus Borrarchaeum sp.]|uniref:hypothetical protein n=1 Tax=Candidatus Borrarchaeum sp. TaxID=2846742 RepID=UPI002580DFEB|nr:hypothetical protein [Candidatus Borrarchaeum sp.]
MTQQTREIPYYFEKLIMGSLISASMSSIIFVFFMSFRTYVSDPSTLVSYSLLFAGIFFAGLFSGMFILEVPRIVPLHGGLITGIILGIICLVININVVMINETVDFIAFALIFITAILSALIGAFTHSNYLAQNQ